MTQRTIPAGEFKARCLKLMDEVSRTGEEIVVTKRGKPVARLVAVKPAAEPETLFGYMKGTIEIVGDIVSPIDVDWNAKEGVDWLDDTPRKRTHKRR